LLRPRHALDHHYLADRFAGSTIIKSVSADERHAGRGISDVSHFMTERIILGGCLCGAVRYEARGEPYNITHCHCADCRRSSGAAFVTWASFRRRDFLFTKGESREFAWAERFRAFCAQCGTPLTFTAERDANEIDVTVCTFDDPGAVLPADHTWTEDRLRWIHLDELPAHERQRPSP